MHLLSYLSSFSNSNVPIDSTKGVSIILAINCHGKSSSAVIVRRRIEEGERLNFVREFAMRIKDETKLYRLIIKEIICKYCIK